MPQIACSMTRKEIKQIDEHVQNDRDRGNKASRSHYISSAVRQKLKGKPIFHEEKLVGYLQVNEKVRSALENSGFRIG